MHEQTVFACISLSIDHELSICVIVCGLPTFTPACLSCRCRARTLLRVSERRTLSPSTSANKRVLTLTRELETCRRWRKLSQRLACCCMMLCVAVARMPRLHALTRRSRVMYKLSFGCLEDDSAFMLWHFEIWKRYCFFMSGEYCRALRVCVDTMSLILMSCTLHVLSLPRFVSTAILASCLSSSCLAVRCSKSFVMFATSSRITTATCKIWSLPCKRTSSSYCKHVPASAPPRPH